MLREWAPDELERIAKTVVGKSLSSSEDLYKRC